ncbi:TetR/AcrR family transcriptional regulator [Paenibacillus sp. NPDC058174]|uniref:TetR/AcrR family transcriptional regulator n=1 Tax=Paenibacillus sp. NPDC058174 TaxID=3346366 RepID=UPI0036DB2324
MVKEKVDLRILKTKKAIKEAFLSLIQTKGYEKISVQDIADTAMINRNTFYLHYSDKLALMESLCLESVEKLTVSFRMNMSNMHKMDKETLRSSLRNMFEVIETNIIFFQAMLSPSGYPNSSIYLKNTIKKFVLDDTGHQDLNRNIMMSLEYMISGLVGVITMWVADHENLEVEEVIEQLSELHFNNLLYMVNNHL